MPSHTKLTSEERCVLSAFLKEGFSLRMIATKMHRSVSTISDEVRRGGGREVYDPYKTHLQAKLRRWEANTCNPAKSLLFDLYTEEKLREGWSPEIIAGRLKIEFPNDPSMHAVHETIYRRSYEKGLTKLLPRGLPRRERRKHRLKKAVGNQGLGLVRRIEERPRSADTRSVFGHWEGDTMLSSRQRGAALSVQQERRSRYALFSKIQSKTAKEMSKAVQRHLEPFPSSLQQSMTLDRGTENAEWERFGLPVYFCDPYSSWQKGSVEQLIGLIRRYIPKGTDLNTISEEEISAIQDKLNHRPRKCLGFKTPYEVFSVHCTKLGVRI